MFATPFELLLVNLRGDLPEDMPWFTPQTEAYEKLKQFSGEDFGYDVDRWEQWGLDHDQLLFPAVKKALSMSTSRPVERND